MFYENATGQPWRPDGSVTTVADSPQGGAGTEVSWGLVLAHWPKADILLAFGITEEAWPPVPAGHDVTTRIARPGNPVVFEQTTAPSDPRPLSRPEFVMLLDEMGIRAQVDQAVTDVKGRPGKAEKLAGYIVEEGNSFEYARTLRLTQSLAPQLGITDANLRPAWLEIAALEDAL